MARKLRILFEGAIYHVTLRGVERRRLFDDDDDRARFVKRLEEAVEEYGVRLYLFCLMTNHVHLLVETPKANLSAFMHKLQTAYTVYYNVRHKRTGHLMQGRYGAKPVDGDEYLLSLSRYIHLNPVFVGAMRKQPLERRQGELRAYPWSSFRGYAGLAEPAGFVDEGPLLALVAGAEWRKRVAYGKLVAAGLAETDEEFLDVLKQSPWGIGGNEFQEQMRRRHQDLAQEAKRPEDVSFRRVSANQAPEFVLRKTAESWGVDPEGLRKRAYGCQARSAAAYLLGRHAGMNQRDIASYMRMGSGSAVCRQLIRLRSLRGKDPGLDARLRQLDSEMEKEADQTVCQ